ncbi:fasciclin domain-containing protein [Thermostichus vulcanus]|uniref:Fasciclin domain-containing protein n=1 Tax=Thermostichus vulcanus str. 'Rupite' TaxID=2813851 RepID=A0ABT0CEQ7_THEVL|nr:fasciclin domain-containing protein [Thermostichus vulcanus]MCJ2544269.1 fasciclin domain-containing protein [Thermostichus vulcanus str. 'Rupite']
MSVRKFFLLGLVALASLTLVACGSGSSETAISPPQPSPTVSPTPAPQDIVTIASGNPDFSTLVAALQAADLVGALQAEGPFTVFAPTNAAFAALPAGTVESLLLPENQAELVRILTYHVVSGLAPSSALSSGQQVTTLEGSPVTVTIEGGQIRINDSNVVVADIEASNGIIHVIDAVLIPPQ